MKVKNNNMLRTWLLAALVIICCGLVSGILFANVSKAVSLSASLKFNDTIYFSIGLQVDFNGDGDFSDSATYNNGTTEFVYQESNAYSIFNNSAGGETVNWAMVTANDSLETGARSTLYISPSNGGDTNPFNAITKDSCFKLIITNLTNDASKCLNFTFTPDNGDSVDEYALLPVPNNGLYNIAYNASSEILLTPQNVLYDGMYEIGLEVSLAAKATDYTLTNTLTNVSTSNTLQTKVHAGYDYITQLTATTGVITSYSVMVGGSTLTAGTQYTFENGQLVIFGQYITGNVVITATAA